ncbi:MAG: hypothetical protein ACK517_00875 [bacterium]|jgi:hypothetical protein
MSVGGPMSTSKSENRTFLYEYPFSVILFDLFIMMFPSCFVAIGLFLMTANLDFSETPNAWNEAVNAQIFFGAAFFLIGLIFIWSIVRLWFYRKRFYIKILDDSIEYQWIEGKKKTFLFSQIEDYLTSEGVLTLRHNDPFSSLSVQLYYMSRTNREVLLELIEAKCGFPPSRRD